MSSSPFSMKCDTHLHYVCLPSEEKGDAGNTGAYHIRCPCPKISGPALSLSQHLAIFQNCPALALRSPQTTSRHRHLLSSTPAPELVVMSSPTTEHVVTSTTASERTTTSSPTKSTSPAILNPKAQYHQPQACCCHPRPQARHRRPHRCCPTLCFPGAPPHLCERLVNAPMVRVR
jgi:hypothetical protein